MVSFLLLLGGSNYQKMQIGMYQITCIMQVLKSSYFEMLSIILAQKKLEMLAKERIVAKSVVASRCFSLCSSSVSALIG